MDENVIDAEFLRGRLVSFTGRLASMARTEATQLVEKLGGQVASGINRQTSFLIVGQEGWPLRKDGRLTQKLQKARLLQRRGYTVSILAEDEWLERLGLGYHCAEIRRRYSVAELVAFVKISRIRLQAWIQQGLIRPVEICQGVAYFDYRQVTGVRSLCSLLQAGVGLKRIKRSLNLLQLWAGKIEHPLTQLTVEHDGHLLVRVGERLAEPTGQLLLEFEEGQADPSLDFLENRLSADHWFDLGCQHEEASRLEEAEAAYRESMRVGGPKSDCCFNLGNVLLALGRKAEAVERFSQLVEMDGQNAEAWNNLGNALYELGRFGDAKVAYQRAVQLGYADAHYNLADLLLELGEPKEASLHWQTYLKHDQYSPWATYARSSLRQAGDNR